MYWSTTDVRPQFWHDDIKTFFLLNFQPENLVITDILILETWIGRWHRWFYFETFNQRIVVKKIYWGLLIRIGRGDEWGLARQPQSIFFCQLFPLLFSYFCFFFFLLSYLSLSNFMGRGCQLFPLLIDFIFASAKYFSLKTSANLNGFQQKANLLGKTTFSAFSIQQKTQQESSEIHCKIISLPKYRSELASTV